MEMMKGTSKVNEVRGSSTEEYLVSQYNDLIIKGVNNSQELFTMLKIKDTINWAAQGHEQLINKALLLEETLKNFFDGITSQEIAETLILASVGLIEQDPAYGYVAARLLFKKLYKEVTHRSIKDTNIEQLYTHSFIDGIYRGVQEDIFDKRLMDFDLSFLATHLKPERDYLFNFMGLRTLYERYFTKIGSQRCELPQSFWMRVAMGLCLNEQDKNSKAIEFYTIISQMDYIPSTPTLLHSGLTRPQLSSCFLTTVLDDLKHIFKCIGDNAQLSKWSGGVAGDWSYVRATGAMIKSIKTESQGVIPFLKIANDTTAAINRSGKRRSASVVYLSVYHLDIEDFIDLRKNTGDERRRTHDINTATWIPDLFMKRIETDEEWTLFSPHEVPELHDLYGAAFEKKYVEYEQLARAGKMEMHKILPAKQLWRKIITRLFETGHPWITFKDPSNIRSPQDHAGVVHSSNLCTEITLNTSEKETAVCNLGSINLAAHVEYKKINFDKLAVTIKHAMRMLDNVIDINFYPTQEAQESNFLHRPVGLGLMGLQDALYKLELSFDEPQVLPLVDELMEFISYHAILNSSKLAQERGAYSSYKGSKWDRNIFPIDTLDLLEKERGQKLTIDRTIRLDWQPVRKHVQLYGMRNSNTMAIAPTATISNIADCSPCGEPIYKNIYVKANMSGEFTVVNKFLVQDLKNLNLWDQGMLDMLKYYDGNLQRIDTIPAPIKERYKEVFEIDPLWLVQLTAARAKWIDQSQSHNVFLQGVSGKQLHDIYFAGWKSGMKTFYYLRTLGATQIEKSTLDAQKFGFTQKRTYVSMSTQELNITAGTELANESADLAESQIEAAACNILQDPSCEVCQ